MKMCNNHTDAIIVVFKDGFCPLCKSYIENKDLTVELIDLKTMIKNLKTE